MLSISEIAEIWEQSSLYMRKCAEIFLDISKYLNVCSLTLWQSVSEV